MQITLLFFYLKKFNIIKKGINIKDTLKLYAVVNYGRIYGCTQATWQLAEIFFDLNSQADRGTKIMENLPY